MQIDDDFYLAPRSADEVEDMSVFINHYLRSACGFSWPGGLAGDA